MEDQRILGIDPGSRCTGCGIIELTKTNQYRCVDYQNIHCKQDNLAERLYHIYESIYSLIQRYQPQQAAIEKVFTAHNHRAALTLGQARGAALVALAGAGLPITEYSAKQVKLAVVGYGAAAKSQVQHMVKMLLKLTKSPGSDAADALAIALCHANSRSLSQKLAKV